jgi:hypothetical protein
MEGILVDFRRLLRFSSGLPDLTTYLVDLSIFASGRFLKGCNEILSETYERKGDCVGSQEVEKAIEKEMNLHHPCITTPIGFIFPAKRK